MNKRFLCERKVPFQFEPSFFMPFKSAGTVPVGADSQHTGSVRTSGRDRLKEQGLDIFVAVARPAIPTFTYHQTAPIVIQVVSSHVPDKLSSLFNSWDCKVSTKLRNHRANNTHVRANNSHLSASTLLLFATCMSYYESEATTTVPG